MTGDYLTHVTLTTGDSRRSYRSECDDGVIAQLGPVVLACEATGTAEFPSPTGVMRLDRITDTERPSRHVAIWAIREPQGPALVTLALAMTARAGAGVWRALHERHDEPVPLATGPAEAPAAPWLGVIVHVPAIVPAPHPALSWLGDAERCIAWAWIEGWLEGVYEERP
ncbi:MAG TPA: hypothetical protein VFG73_02340 [Rhodanobacteraceae bacterium]|nr:hypothetical protein [Rhodanobacteraceae bacterium]